MSAKIALGVGAALTTAVAAGYYVANSAQYHQGESGLGSCTTAEEACTAAYGDYKVQPLLNVNVVVTGGNSGIGQTTAQTFALFGAKVILPCRTMDKANKAKEEIELYCADKGVIATVVPMVMDLNDLTTVQKFSTELAGIVDYVDILLCNAGIMALPERTETAQGFEAQIGVCHLGHFTLFQNIIGLLKKAPGHSRVVAVSSMGHRGAKNTDWIFHSKLEIAEYEPWEVYGIAKMSNVLFAKEIDEKYHRDGIRAFSLHPGGIHTNLQSHVRIGTKIFWAIVTPFFFKNKDQGAATSVFCAVSPKALDNSGEYFSDCNVEKTAHEDWMNDKALREKLWQTSEKLTGAFVSNKQ